MCFPYIRFSVRRGGSLQEEEEEAQVSVAPGVWPSLDDEMMMARAPVRDPLSVNRNRSE